MRIVTGCLILFILLGCNSDRGEKPSFTVVGLKTDYLDNPIGIDNPAPRLTWKMSDERKGTKQSAYRIVLGTDSMALVEDEKGTWDTGKVATDEQLIVYDGDPLLPFTRYFWKVIVWDKEGEQASAEIHSFETGMMDIANWQGAWISDGNDIHHEPAPYFRKEFNAEKKDRGRTGLYSCWRIGGSVR